MRHFEVYIDSRGYGQVRAKGETWPCGNEPILYAHFLTLSHAGGASIPQFGSGKAPVFRPDQLLYIGERRTLSNYYDGFKQNGYNWLAAIPDSMICSVYWPLEPEFSVDNDRKTLEAMVYNDLFQRYQMMPDVLRYNGGMQFTRARSHHLMILKRKYQILADFTDLGI